MQPTLASSSAEQPRRVTAPNPTQSRATRGLKRPATDARSSVCQRLFDRQTGAGTAHLFEQQSVRQRFSNFRPRATCDLYAAAGGGAAGSSDHQGSHLMRSPITEIIIGGGLIFGLAKSGICAAFDMDTGKRVCVINLSEEEVVRSLFHNKTNQTIIIISVNESDHYSMLRCRSWCVGRAGAASPRRGRADLAPHVRCLAAQLPG